MCYRSNLVWWAQNRAILPQNSFMARVTVVYQSNFEDHADPIIASDKCIKKLAYNWLLH